MSIRSLQHRYHSFLLLSLCVLACGDGQLAAAPVGAPQPPLQSAKIVGGGGLNLAVYETGKADGPPYRPNHCRAHPKGCEAESRIPTAWQVPPSPGFVVPLQQEGLLRGSGARITGAVPKA